jgi:hypothetical protein
VLSQEQRERVVRALEFDPDADDLVDLVGKLESAEELHQFVLNYNPNDGLLPLEAVVRHPNCDRGTSLLVYWNLADLVLDREPHRHKIRPGWNGVALVELIEDRTSRKLYSTANIAFDPLEFMQWSQSRVSRLRLQQGGRLPFPEEMLHASPGASVPPEDF